jgi:hypothetical protein
VVATPTIRDMKLFRNLLNAQLMHGAQASSTDTEPLLLAIDDQGSLLGIEFPLPIGSAL